MSLTEKLTVLWHGPIRHPGNNAGSLGRLTHVDLCDNKSLKLFYN